jgi:hypothetical protein
MVSAVLRPLATKGLSYCEAPDAVQQKGLPSRDGPCCEAACGKPCATPHRWRWPGFSSGPKAAGWEPMITPKNQAGTAATRICWPRCL